jgi:hypothetical protein
MISLQWQKPVNTSFSQTDPHPHEIRNRGTQSQLKDGDRVCLEESVRKDVKKEDCTIVNHYHGVSSSTEDRCNVYRQIGVSGKFWNLNRECL